MIIDERNLTRVCVCDCSSKAKRQKEARSKSDHCPSTSSVIGHFGGDILQVLRSPSCSDFHDAMGERAIACAPRRRRRACVFGIIDRHEGSTIGGFAPCLHDREICPAALGNLSD